MNPRAPKRLAWIGACLGLAIALLAFAPARWLADAVTRATASQVQLVNARGTVWSGSADLMFTGGEGSRDRSALPQGLQWRLGLGLAGAWPALALNLRAPCCTPDPLAIRLRPHWGGLEWHLGATRSAWPADLLAGLGTPWNTLGIDGLLHLQTQGLALRTDRGRLNLNVTLVIDAVDLGSRLARVRPLGSYRSTLSATADGNSATLTLETLRGDLRLQGQGEWVGGRLRFNGFGEAAPGAEAALTNLLNIMGRRQGPRSVFAIG